MKKEASGALANLISKEPLFDEVRAGRMRIKLGMGCSIYSGSSLKMERGRVHPAPQNGAESMQTYSVDKGYVQSGTRIVACGLGPISVDEDYAMSHDMNQHLEDCLIAESRVQVGDAAVLNSTNAGGQGNKSKLTPDNPKIKKAKIIDVVRYVYVNFQHVR